MTPTPRGQFRTSVVIEQPVATRNEYRDNVQQWDVVATVWAKVKSKSGSLVALTQADTITALATHEITIRYNPAYVGIVTNRFRIGASTDFADLNDSQYAGLSDADYSALVGDQNPPPRYFTINTGGDVDEWRREIMFAVTEVKR